MRLNDLLRWLFSQCSSLSALPQVLEACLTPPWTLLFQKRTRCSQSPFCFKSQGPLDQKTQGSVWCHGAMSGDGAPSLHRSVLGWRWVPAGARGRAGTVNRCLSRGAQPGSETCDPASPKVFYRRPSSPIEIYFHSWKKSMGCDYCCSRCFLCKQKIESHKCGVRIQINTCSILVQGFPKYFHVEDPQNRHTDPQFKGTCLIEYPLSISGFYFQGWR